LSSSIRPAQAQVSRPANSSRASRRNRSSMSPAIPLHSHAISPR
jgi:hypothetical protein